MDAATTLVYGKDVVLFLIRRDSYASLNYTASLSDAAYRPSLGVANDGNLVGRR